MSEFKILETKYSVRYDTLPQEDPDNLVNSVESAVLVAHVMYQYLGRAFSLSVDLGVIATKSVNPSTGLVTEFVDKGLKITAEDLKTKVTEAVNAKIKSDESATMYESTVRSFLVDTQRKFTVLERYSQSGLGDPMNSFDF